MVAVLRAAGKARKAREAVEREADEKNKRE